MSTVLTLDNVQLAFGMTPLLDHASLRIERGERVCLLGRNGEGKSSLLKIIAGSLAPDGGEVAIPDGVEVSVLPQELPEAGESRVWDIVAGAFPETARLLDEFAALSADAGEASMKQLQKVQDQLDALDGWRFDQRIRQVLQEYGLEPDMRMATLSGGWQRRVLLARAMVTNPDLLLLDEPTNHLDVPAIRWLENALEQFSGAVLFVSHDRAFIRRMANRILELDRGHLSSWPGDYDRYLADKEKALEEEERRNAEFDRKLAQEERWIRQGIKARRTRNQGRVRHLKALREERRQRREQTGKARLQIEDAGRSGKLVAEAVDASFGYPGQPPLIEGLNLTVLSGDKVGLIGENGSGKSTLLKLLLGELEPTSGEIRRGTRQQVAYFEQLRSELDPEKTALDNLSEGREFIEINGRKKHIMGYLGEFLFTPERARTPVSVLSGGERARLLLAKLFSQPANILVLDEPTNDLDVDTLELLEAQLVDFPGTVILITHDREFLDNVVGSVLFLDGRGTVAETIGGYQDWRREGGQFPSEFSPAPASNPEPSGDGQSPMRSGSQDGGARKRKPASTTKLSYKLKRELEQLPGRISTLEDEVASLHARAGDPAFYQQSDEEIRAVLDTLARREQELEEAIERWMELEEMTES